MPRLKMKYGFLFLIAAYAVISNIPLHFSSRGVVVAATIFFDILSVFVLGCLISLVVLTLKSNKVAQKGEGRNWGWAFVRFALSFVLACFLFLCLVRARNVAFLPPGTWDRPQFAYGWPVPWRWEPLGCDIFGWAMLLDVLFYLSLSFFMCGFRKLWFHVAVYLLPILVIVGLAMCSGEDGLNDLCTTLFSSRHPQLN